jgi:hypothetical protein
VVVGHYVRLGGFIFSSAVSPETCSVQAKGEVYCVRQCELIKRNMRSHAGFRHRESLRCHGCQSASWLLNRFVGCAQVRRLVSTCCDAKRGWSIVTSSKSSTRFWFFDCQDFKESPCFLFALVLRIRSSITSIAVLEANAIGRPETVAVMSGTRTI